MVGGGAKITGNSTANATAVIQDTYPSGALTWSATAIETVHAGNGSPPSVAAYAICAN
jgi:hypothetical protein